MMTLHIKQLQAHHASAVLSRTASLLNLQCTSNAQMCSKSTQHSGSGTYGSGPLQQGCGSAVKCTAFQKHQTFEHNGQQESFWTRGSLERSIAFLLQSDHLTSENSVQIQKILKTFRVKVIMPVEVNKTSWLNYNLTPRSTGVFCLHHRLMHISHGQMTGCTVYKYFILCERKRCLYAHCQ